MAAQPTVSYSSLLHYKTQLDEHIDTFNKGFTLFERGVLTKSNLE